VVPEGTAVLNPACDVTPHDLVGAIVTEEGILRAPLGPAIADALERRTARHAPLADVRATLVRTETG
jgi:methylthioribose-1-phosphate isomerase